MALSVIEGIAKTAAATGTPTATTTSNPFGQTARIPRPSCPRPRSPQTAGSPGCPSPSTAAVSRSASRRSALAESSTEACRSSSGGEGFTDRFGDKVGEVLSTRSGQYVHNSLKHVDVQQELEGEDEL